MELFISAATIAAYALLIFMSAGWIISVIIKDASIVDRMWGAGFVLIAWVTILYTGNLSVKNILVVTATTIWGLRLFLHITLRSAGKGEDHRYTLMREAVGKNFTLVSFFSVFMLQAFFLLIVGSPLIFIIVYSSSLAISDYFAMVLWAGGFLFETAADFQLFMFKKNSANKGRIMTKGLWSLSRHPNYFGDSVVWWSIFFFALSIDCGFLTIVSPIVITFLLLKVSGVAMLEKTRYTGNTEYEEYKKRTSVFIPWFPRKSA